MLSRGSGGRPERWRRIRGGISGWIVGLSFSDDFFVLEEASILNLNEGTSGTGWNGPNVM